MIIKVSVSRLLKRYLDPSYNKELPTKPPLSTEIKVWLEDFAEWLDVLDIEKVIGNR